MVNENHVISVYSFVLCSEQTSSLAHCVLDFHGLQHVLNTSLSFDITFENSG